MDVPHYWTADQVQRLLDALAAHNRHQARTAALIMWRTGLRVSRDPHTIGRWAAAFGEGGPRALIFEQTGGSPPALGEAQREELRAAVQQLPAAAGLDLANWNWKVVHRFVWERCGLSLCRSSCLTYLRRLGFAFKRPKKRLLKADEEKREAFVAAYAALREEAVGSGAKICFADEAHFRADAVPMRSCGAGGCCGESQPW